MKRILALLATAAALVGCGDNIHSAPPPNTPGKVGSGAINALTTETVSLTATTQYTAEQYTGSIDLVGDQFQTDGSSTVVCTAPTLECSNSYNASVDTHTDDTKWIPVTLSIAPPALASGANKFFVQYSAWPCAYWRWAITCSAGTGTLTLTHMKKGG